MVGQSRADKVWYKEFRKKWKPYVSGIYQRCAVPKKNIVCIAIPVFASPSQSKLSTNRIEEKKGILQFQIDLKILLSWTHVDSGTTGTIHIVDQYGRCVGNPGEKGRYETLDSIPSSLLTVAQSKGKGVLTNEELFGNESKIAAFRLIPEFGWIVLVTQPVRQALKERNATLSMLFIICFLVFCLIILLGFTVNQLLRLQQESGEILDEKNKELKTMNETLIDAIEKIKTLKGLIPICAHCKRIRDDSGFWQQIEIYVKSHSDAEFSHGICPECIQKFYPAMRNRKTTEIKEKAL
jgi:sensor histidine kinase YesM